MVSFHIRSIIFLPILTPLISGRSPPSPTTPTTSSRRRLKNADGLSFGNDVYTVTFSSKEDFPLFGCKYNFQLEGVVDCPEFLVNLEMFKILAREQGLELVNCWTFEEFFNEFRTAEGASLLQKMNALETYPPFKGASLAGEEDDYTHAMAVHQETGDTLVRSLCIFSFTSVVYALATVTSPCSMAPHVERHFGVENWRPDRKKLPSLQGTLSRPEWEALTVYVAYAFVKK